MSYSRGYVYNGVVIEECSREYVYNGVVTEDCNRVDNCEGNGFNLLSLIFNMSIKIKNTLMISSSETNEGLSRLADSQYECLEQLLGRRMLKWLSRTAV